MTQPTVELVMGVFGEERMNAGNGALPADPLDPTLASMRRFFPELTLTVYTDTGRDFDSGGVPLTVRRVEPPFDRTHPRYGWRCANHYRAVGLLEARAEVAIYMDSDMQAVSARVRTLLPLARRFGLCLPANPRMLVAVDGLRGSDSDYREEEDESDGTGFAYNISPIAFATGDARMRRLLETYRDQVRGRGTLAMWRAVWQTGLTPYLLPFQWCVCGPHVGCGEEIVLHHGHRIVQDYYGDDPLRRLLARVRFHWWSVRGRFRRTR